MQYIADTFWFYFSADNSLDYQQIQGSAIHFHLHEIGL